MIAANALKEVPAALAVMGTMLVEVVLATLPETVPLGAADGKYDREGVDSGTTFGVTLAGTWTELSVWAPGPPGPPGLDGFSTGAFSASAGAFSASAGAFGAEASEGLLALCRLRPWLPLAGFIAFNGPWVPYLPLALALFLTKAVAGKDRHPWLIARWIQAGHLGENATHCMASKIFCSVRFVR